VGCASPLRARARLARAGNGGVRITHREGVQRQRHLALRARGGRRGRRGSAGLAAQPRAPPRAERRAQAGNSRSSHLGRSTRQNRRRLFERLRAADGGYAGWRRRAAAALGGRSVRAPSSITQTAQRHTDSSVLSACARHGGLHRRRAGAGRRRLLQVRALAGEQRQEDEGRRARLPRALAGGARRGGGDGAAEGVERDVLRALARGQGGGAGALRPMRAAAARPPARAPRAPRPRSRARARRRTWPSKWRRL